MKNKSISKPKTILIFVTTIILGFILFLLPNLFFGITKINGGPSGINLAIIAIFQLVTVSTLLYFSLKKLNLDFRFIGLSFQNWKKDCLLGVLTGLGWAVLNFGLILPNTGGATRPDVLEVINGLDGSIVGLISFIILGVVGGGITEEIYNRGYFITVLKGTFKNPNVGLWVATASSILFFAAGHFPSNFIEWVDILISTISFTILFLTTKRLTASIVAHGTWNMTAILWINFMY